MWLFAVHASDLHIGDVTTDDGALLAIVAVERGDDLAADRISSRAAADLDRTAAELAAEMVVLLAVTHDDPGPGYHRRVLAAGPEPFPNAIGERLDAEAVVVPPEEYPELSLSGPVHPTALQARRYDGTSTPSRDLPTPAFDRLERAGLVDGSVDAWTARGLFFRDELLDRTRSAAIAAGAVPRSGHGGGPAPVNDTITYDVRRTPAGPQPELSVVRDERADAVDDVERFLSLGVELLATIGPSLRITVSGVNDDEIDRLRTALPPETTVEQADVDVVRASRAPEQTDPIRAVASAANCPVAWVDATVLADGRWSVRCAPVGRFGTTAGVPFDDERPVLQAAIAPTQLRLVPIDPEHERRCVEDAVRLAERGVRVDVDDRRLSVGQRLDRVRSEGVPLYAVVGNRELDSDGLPLADRRDRTQRSTPIDAVPSVIGEVGGRERYGPVRLSDRP